MKKILSTLAALICCTQMFATPWGRKTFTLNMGKDQKKQTIDLFYDVHLLQAATEKYVIDDPKETLEENEKLAKGLTSDIKKTSKKPKILIEFIHGLGKNIFFLEKIKQAARHENIDIVDVDSRKGTLIELQKTAFPKEVSFKGAETLENIIKMSQTISRKDMLAHEKQLARNAKKILAKIYKQIEKGIEALKKRLELPENKKMTDVLNDRIEELEKMFPEEKEFLEAFRPYAQLKKKLPSDRFMLFKEDLAIALNPMLDINTMFEIEKALNKGFDVFVFVGGTHAQEIAKFIEKIYAKKIKKVEAFGQTEGF